jgi:aminoglycoside phosphotransferase family enzyme
LVHEEWLCLNRRFAPALYLDVVPIVTGPTSGSVCIASSGMPIEHALRMRRFDQQDLLSARIAADRLEPGHIDRPWRALRHRHLRSQPRDAARPRRRPCPGGDLSDADDGVLA